MFTPILNLLILFSFRQMEHKFLLMDKITVGLRWAVYYLLNAEGIAGGRLGMLASGTPNAFVQMARRTFSVKA